MYLLRQLHKVRNSQEWRLCQFQKSFSELYKQRDLQTLVIEKS